MPSLEIRNDAGNQRQITGEKIEPRDSHISFVHEDQFIIIHGGMIHNEANLELVAVSVRDDKSIQIREVYGTSPGIRESHSCVKFDQLIIIYGGFCIF